MSDRIQSFERRHAAVLAAFDRLRDPQERLAWVVEQARLRPAFNPEWRRDEFLVRGCAARLWVHRRMEHGRCRFACDSDSAILKALGGLLCALYDDLPPEEVEACTPDFLGSSRLLDQLSENRRRTVLRIREVIREFALAPV